MNPGSKRFRSGTDAGEDNRTAPYNHAQNNQNQPGNDPQSTLRKLNDLSQILRSIHLDASEENPANWPQMMANIGMGLKNVENLLQQLPDVVFHYKVAVLEETVKTARLFVSGSSGQASFRPNQNQKNAVLGLVHVEVNAFLKNISEIEKDLEDKRGVAPQFKIYHTTESLQSFLKEEVNTQGLASKIRSDFEARRTKWTTGLSSNSEKLFGFLTELESVVLPLQTQEIGGNYRSAIAKRARAISNLCERMQSSYERWFVGGTSESQKWDAQFEGISDSTQKLKNVSERFNSEIDTPGSQSEELVKKCKEEIAPVFETLQKHAQNIKNLCGVVADREQPEYNLHITSTSTVGVCTSQHLYAPLKMSTAQSSSSNNETEYPGSYTLPLMPSVADPRKDLFMLKNLYETFYTSIKIVICIDTPEFHQRPKYMIKVLDELGERISMLPGDLKTTAELYHNLLKNFVPIIRKFCQPDHQEGENVPCFNYMKRTVEDLTMPIAIEVFKIIGTIDKFDGIIHVPKTNLNKQLIELANLNKINICLIEMLICLNEPEFKNIPESVAYVMETLECVENNVLHGPKTMITKEQVQDFSAQLRSIYPLITSQFEACCKRTVDTTVPLNTMIAIMEQTTLSFRAEIIKATKMNTRKQTSQHDDHEHPEDEREEQPANLEDQEDQEGEDPEHEHQAAAEEGELERNEKHYEEMDRAWNAIRNELECLKKEKSGDKYFENVSDFLGDLNDNTKILTNKVQEAFHPSEHSKWNDEIGMLRKESDELLKLITNRKNRILRKEIEKEKAAQDVFERVQHFYRDSSEPLKNLQKLLQEVSGNKYGNKRRPFDPYAKYGNQDRRGMKRPATD